MLPPATDERSCGSTALSAFGAVPALDCGRSNRRVVGSRRFPLHFPDYVQCEMSVHTLSFRLHTFAEESVKVFGSFFFP